MATYHFPVGDARLTITVSNRSTDAFKKYHGPGSQRRLFAQIIRGYRSLAKIAERFGVTRQSVHHHYTSYLKPLLAAAGLKRKTVIKTVVDGPLPAATLAVKRQAIRAALTVGFDYFLDQRLPNRTYRVIRKRSLMIAGQRCKIYVGTTIVQGRLIVCRLRAMSVKDYRYVIFVAAPPGRPHQYFIVPSKMFMNILKSHRPEDYVSLYLPILTKRTRLGRSAAIDWSPYRSAWQLITRT